MTKILSHLILPLTWRYSLPFEQGDPQGPWTSICEDVLIHILPSLPSNPSLLLGQKLVLVFSIGGGGDGGLFYVSTFTFYILKIQRHTLIIQLVHLNYPKLPLTYAMERERSSESVWIILPNPARNQYSCAHLLYYTGTP